MTPSEIKQLAKELAPLVAAELKKSGFAEDEFLTVEQAAEYLGVTRSYLYKHPEIESKGNRKQRRYSKRYLTTLMA